MSDGDTIIEYSTAGKSDITEDKIIMTIDDDSFTAVSVNAAGDVCAGTNSGLLKYTQDDEIIEFAAFQKPIVAMQSISSANNEVQYVVAACDDSIGLWEPLLNQFNIIDLKLMKEDKILDVKVAGECCVVNCGTKVILYNVVSKAVEKQFDTHTAVISTSPDGCACIRSGNKLMVYDQTQKTMVKEMDIAADCVYAWASKDLLITFFETKFVVYFKFEQQGEVDIGQDNSKLFDISGDIVVVAGENNLVGFDFSE